MLLKYIKITNDEGLIRQIDFHVGLNLIVDQTPDNTADSGNNVGKTTLLNIISYCLGGKAEKIYQSADRKENTEVKEFLNETNVEVEMCMAQSMDDNARKVTVRRNFKSGKRAALRTVNGCSANSNDAFTSMLQNALWNTNTTHPSFRQIISRSLRIDQERLQHTLDTLDRFGKNIDLEKLHLYWFGASPDDRKEAVSKELEDARKQLKWLEHDNTSSQLYTQLNRTNSEIYRLEQQKSEYQPNPDFENDLRQLTECKNRLRRLAQQHTQLKTRKQLISDAAHEMKALQSDTREQQVGEIYRQAKAFCPQLHHNYAELLKFHNEMLARRADFVTAEMPEINRKIRECEHEIDENLRLEQQLEDKLQLSVTLQQFDHIVRQLTELYRKKGEIEANTNRIDETRSTIERKEHELGTINDTLFSTEWRNYVQQQVDQFNQYFTSMSQRLYGADFEVMFDIRTQRNNRFYRFWVTAPDNFGDGKKIGEIVCFDMAYVNFATHNQIPCMYFTLYDKLELVHGNQLVTFAEAADAQPLQQSIAAILHDKLPQQLDDNRHVVLTLSETDRLFRMEESAWYKARHRTR